MAADTDEDNEDFLTPIPLPSRTGPSQDRARDLFAKYGVEYGARSNQPSSGPPSKIRRVEKPVRLRVHWTCHECSRQFGTEKICHSCGHRRCRECTRHPAKRSRDVPRSTRRERDLRQQTDSTDVPEVVAGPSSSAIASDLPQYQPQPSAPVVEQPRSSSYQHESGPKGVPRTLAPPVSGNLLGFALELDENTDDSEGGLPSLELFRYARPRAGHNAVLKPKAQIIRRACHKCEKQFRPPHQMDCQNCGHERCDECPRISQRTDRKVPTENTPPMVPAVQRVYRKPRQRVRYTCERCNTLFMNSDLCSECGHERCSNCTREPYALTSISYRKFIASHSLTCSSRPRHTPHYDPAVAASVADRLASNGYGPLGITASAG